MLGTLLGVSSCTNAPAEVRASCAYTESDPSLGDRTPLGFSPSQAIALMSGNWDCVWVWNTPGDAGAMSPPPAQTGATLSIAYTGGRVALEEGSVVGDAAKYRLSCPSWLDVAAELQVQTDDKVLDSTLAVPIEVRNIHTSISSVADVSAGDLGAGFSFSWSGDWSWTRQVIKIWIQTDGTLLGELDEEAGHDPVTSGQHSTGDGVVFKAATWSCTPQ